MGTEDWRNVDRSALSGGSKEIASESFYLNQFNVINSKKKGGHQSTAQKFVIKLAGLLRLVGDPFGDGLILQESFVHCMQVGIV